MHHNSQTFYYAFGLPAYYVVVGTAITSRRVGHCDGCKKGAGKKLERRGVAASAATTCAHTPERCPECGKEKDQG